jgi:hypothetical protein
MDLSFDEGNGTAITSHRSKRVISLGVGLGAPLVETGERVVVDRGFLRAVRITRPSRIV